MMTHVDAEGNINHARSISPMVFSLEIADMQQIRRRTIVHQDHSKRSCSNQDNALYNHQDMESSKRTQWHVIFAQSLDDTLKVRNDA